VRIRRAQIEVNKFGPNPEADETANLWFSSEMLQGQLVEFRYVALVDAQDYPSLNRQESTGIVYVGDDGGISRLFFLPCCNPSSGSTPQPLTDGFIANPKFPSASVGGCLVAFEAAPTLGSDGRRIFSLDLLNGAIKRLTVDQGPNQSSNDFHPVFNLDGSRFAMITTRSGSNTSLNVEDSFIGLSGGQGTVVVSGTTGVGASDADWSHGRNEIAFTDLFGRISTVDPVSKIIKVVGSGNNPRFSPGGEKIGYLSANSLFVMDRDGGNNHSIPNAGGVPAQGDLTWVDDHTIAMPRTVGGNTNIYLIDTNTSASVKLTVGSTDTNPTFVRCIVRRAQITGEP